MQPAQLPAFRAFPWRILFVPPMHVHCAFLQLPLYPLYTPRTLDSQYLPRQLPVFHPSEFATPQSPAADSATTFPEFPALLSIGKFPAKILICVSSQHLYSVSLQFLAFRC
jgi:hypothetical protein